MNFLTQEVNYFILFLTFLFISELLEVYLSIRNRTSIKRNRDKVPDYFKESINLNDHQKAADYQTMIADFGFAFRIYGLLILLFWTVGGYLSKLSLYSSTVTNNDYLNGSFFIVSLIIVNLFLSVPISIIRTFYIEDKFGFNNTTYKTFMLDKIKSLMLSTIISVPLFLSVAYFINTFKDVWWLYSFAFFMLFQLLL